VLPGDDSQWPIEQLAQLLLRQAQNYVVLSPRSAANDDNMPSKPGTLSAIRPEQVLDPPSGRADPANLAVLETLIASALAQAQDAKDLAREASKFMRRGIATCAALGVVGMVIAGIAGYRLASTTRAQIAAIARQFQAIDTGQREISIQLSNVEAQKPLQQASPNSSAQHYRTDRVGDTYSNTCARAAGEPCGSEDAFLAFHREMYRMADNAGRSFGYGFRFGMHEPSWASAGTPVEARVGYPTKSSDGRGSSGP